MYEILHVENPLPSQLPRFYRDGFLFLQARHLLNQPCRPLHYFALINVKTGWADAHCAIFIRDHQAVSPGAASFGSVEFADDVPDADLHRLVTAVVTYCQQVPVQGIRLVNYPDCYAVSAAHRLRVVLLTAGFVVEYEELNQHLPVSSQPFAENLHAAERRRLRKCQQAGFTTQIWENPDSDALFAFIRKARIRKALPLTMDSGTLAGLLTTFGDVCPVFTVRNHHQLIAACLGIRVTPDILYYFLPADHEEYLSFSPSVLLIESLYSYCQQHHISLLDLGISTSKGIPNEGLIRFKKHLGAVESPKFIFGMRF
ncbi:GNAT family N-acetyltransferase [Larkinella bovis]|uniref:GNAT family N-acetyltransferase n=1 Tax=Larkinella bovis TaxID=683041 RepID=A0ABW0I823_9BACT